MVRGLPLLVLALCGANGQMCSSNVTVANGDFEQNAANGIGLGEYRYVGDRLAEIDGWISYGRAIWLGTRSRPWAIVPANQDASGNRFPEGHVVALQKSEEGRQCPGCASTDPGSIEQRVTGLTPGRSYQITMMAAKRPGYAADLQRFSVLIQGTTIAENVNPEYYFSEHSFEFIASSTSTVIKILNTSPAEEHGGTIDHTVFLDNVAVCELATTTTISTATTTTTSITETTHTAFEDMNRELNELRSAMVSSQSAQSQMVSQMEAIAGRLTAAEAVGSTIAEVSTRVNQLTNTIRRAVAALPNPSVNGNRRCTGSICTPSIVAAGNDISIRAATGDVTIETGTCGSMDPCDILMALNSLKDA